MSLEVDLIETGLKTSILNIEHLVLVFEEFLAMLELIGVVNDSSLITVLLMGCVMADKGALFATFDLKLDVGAFDCLQDVDIDHTGNSVSWFIEGILSLELDLSFGEAATLVREEKHSIQNTLLFLFIIISLNILSTL